MWIKSKTIAYNIGLILVVGTMDLTVNSNLDFFSSKARTVCNAIINHNYIICSLDTKFLFTFIVFCILIMYFGLFLF